MHMYSLRYVVAAFICHSGSNLSLYLDSRSNVEYHQNVRDTTYRITNVAHQDGQADELNRRICHIAACLLVVSCEPAILFAHA